ncbi:hypothetical protein KCU98_g9596, partial [Aureobasidium melanogenum]
MSTGLVAQYVTVWDRWQDENGKWWQGTNDMCVFQPDLEDLEVSTSRPTSRAGTPEPEKKRKAEVLTEGPPTKKSKPESS